MKINPFKIWLVVIISLSAIAQQLEAQVRAVQRAVAVDVAVQDEDEEDEDGESGVGKYMGGAMLKTDPDLASLLKKADEYKKEGSYQVASRYWQAVLERSGDTLYSDDGETYYAMTERVESILAELPDEGLRAYRISADATAKEILAQSKGEYDVETLSKIVKTHFVSSLGDEAAYQLAGIFMDQFDFVAATRLLRKITDQYPAPSVPLDDVWLKLAVAYTYLGDGTMAQQAIQKANEVGNSNILVSREIESLVEASPRLVDEATSSSDWVMRMGGPRRFGVMPGLPDDFLQQDLAAVWQYYFPPSVTFTEETFEGNVLMGRESWDAEFARKTVGGTEKNTIEKWRSKHWRPSGHLLITGDDVVFKTGGDVTVWDRSNPSELPKWRPLWFNRFIEDPASSGFRNMNRAYNQGSTFLADQPNAEVDVQYFADRVHQSSSVYRGVMYNIEGQNYSIGGDIPDGNQKSGYNHGQMPRRSRQNCLTAYDMSNGKLLWRQPRPKLLAKSAKKTAEPASDEIDPFEDVGFMSAPVGVGDLLLVPVSQSGSISVYAMDINDGSLIWKSFLCDEPSGGSQPLSPMDLTVQGSSAYISCGTGVLFSLDPLTGTIQFARRYERSGRDDLNANLQNMGLAGKLITDGWETDLVIPVGSTLMLFSSDYSVVWAVDRQTAKFKWKTENRPFNSKFEYLIGVYGDMVYLGGKDSIAAISIKAQGRWEWVEEFGDEFSHGRAMLTPNGLYVPIEDSIAHYSLEGAGGRGEQLSRVGVRLGSGAPVGNLFSDGEKIWVVGANRLYVLDKAPPMEIEDQDSDKNTDGSEGKDSQADDSSD